MMGSSLCVVAMLATLATLAPVGPEASGADPEPDVVDAMLEGLDPATRSERLYARAVEHAEEGQLHDAAVYIVKAYDVLHEDTRHGDTGLFLLTAGAEYHLQAYQQTKDDALLAAIQPRLEDLIEHYLGLDPRLESLQRKLDLVRKLRLDASDRYFRNRDYLNAAKEARGCYEAMMAADKPGAIGERAVLAAASAYRQAWYVDGDIRQLEAAIELVADHLDDAGEEASVKAKRARAQLGRDLALAKARGGGIDGEDDLPGIAPQERSFLFASGAALGGGLVLAAGAAAVGAYGFEYSILSINEEAPSRPQPEHIAVAVPLGVVSGVVTGLAIHSMIDTGFIPPRERKLLAIGATTLGLLGAVVGTSLLAVGASRRDDPSSARGLQNTGFSILVGIGAPLGAGIAALVSRRAGGR